MTLVEGVRRRGKLAGHTCVAWCGEKFGRKMKVLGSSSVACTEAKWMNRDRGACGAAMSKRTTCAA